jgi:hypothetical protein
MKTDDNRLPTVTYKMRDCDLIEHFKVLQMATPAHISHSTTCALYIYVQRGLHSACANHPSLCLQYRGQWPPTLPTLQTQPPTPVPISHPCACRPRSQGTRFHQGEGAAQSASSGPCLGSGGHAAGWGCRGSGCTCECCPSRTSWPHCSSICTTTTAASPRSGSKGTHHMQLLCKLHSSRSSHGRRVISTLCTGSEHR